MLAASRTFATRSLRTFSTSVPKLDVAATAASTSTTATTTAASASTTASTATATTSTTAAAAKATTVLPRTYFVERTKAGQLPVYSEFRNAGTRPLTIIRKIQGNATALKTDLLLTYPRVEVRINERSNHVILKGLVMDDVRQWLTAKGF